MSIDLKKVLISLFLILGVCSNNIQASETGSITVTVTFEEIISNVIVISPANQSGDPGGTITYKFQVKNNGTSQDSYNLETTSPNKWNTQLPQGSTIGPINPGQQEDVDVWLTIPPKLLAGTEGLLTLTVISLSNPTVSSSGSVTTTVNQVAGVDIQISSKPKRGKPGQILSLQGSIRNIGNGDDSFILTASSSLGWEIEFPNGNTIGPLGARKREKIYTRVIIPVNAEKGQRDNVTITATSQFDPSVLQSSSFTIIVQ